MKLKPNTEIIHSLNDDDLQSLNTTLDGISQYLSGNITRKKFKNSLKQYDKHPIKLHRDFKVISMDNQNIEGFQSKVNQILDAVKGSRFVSKEDLEKLKAEKSLYSFLERLCQLEFEQARHILALVDDKNSKKLIFAGVALATIPTVALLLMDPVVLNAVEVVKEVATSAMGIPIIGMAFAGIIALYSLYENHFDKKKTFSERFFNNCYILASTALNIASKAVLLASAAVLAPVSAALTTLASVIEVAKQATIYIRYAQKRKETKKNAPEPTGDELIRDKFNLAKHKNLLLINITTAVLLVGITAAWAFVPGGAVVTAAAIAAIVAVRLTKFIATKVYQKRAREKLQLALNTYAQESKLTADSVLTESISLGTALTQKVATEPQLAVISEEVQTLANPVIENKRGSIKEDSTASIAETLSVASTELLDAGRQEASSASQTSLGERDLFVKKEDKEHANLFARNVFVAVGATRGTFFKTPKQPEVKSASMEVEARP